MMARFEDHDATVGADLYAELLIAEEDKFARLGGRRVLVGDKMVIIASPGPVLAALRAGKPVALSDWNLPRWARSGRVQNRRVIVHPGDIAVTAEW
ncbi:hypothetical protein [Mycolicibacterium sp. 120270]|uniref:hypothetical protein n=1 Tax=Mycolicibacterium sp. 120270 TaxID=3090600 RepID=UPI00299DB0B2|nr:hypothetical protein [Mycolicibacterium sp. 120270]MDX1885364.1 hypothetical protein [Mycolicibacterium sp. 120270]